MGRTSDGVNYSFPLKTFPFIPTKYYTVNFKVHNYVHKNCKKMSLGDGTPSVSEDSIQESIVGTMDNRKRLESHFFFFLNTWKTTLKESRDTGKWVCFHVYLQTFEITPVCDIVNQSMISVCLYLNKEVHWESCVWLAIWYHLLWFTKSFFSFDSHFSLKT